ncbi:uncharacterized protein PHALS_04355 [Plasmopara halstedii]|uniref:Uncharacterized protein n=1 Tax=Plasmopara halstedii TaxID=4781 RepID=A0A0P1B053_PLAHL|nr:uncharacterized protein PHALS_04355 [Plasmopara halstedii]CEG47484.1 hypothetical protein PHALS_04355 [Plasmopara halstedii]|eukprot:XP_024583853.1 hypothetical protein PHALS_04355 [Plasmopara halstedii]
MAERYIDVEGFEAYEDNDGQELTLQKLVSASVGDAFDAWLRLVWLGHGSTLQSGEGRGLVGHRRSFSLGVEEKILSAGLPDNSDRIPTLRFSIQKSGVLMLSSHVALVQFVADRTASPSHPKTLIIWSCKFVPSTAGGVLFCGGFFSRMMIKSVLSSSLEEIEASFQPK